MKLNDINGLDLGYTQAMMAGLIFIPRVQTATIMGLGAGSMVKNLLSSFSELKVHAIENREAVAQIAKEYFHLPDTCFLYTTDDADDKQSVILSVRLNIKKKNYNIIAVLLK